jgi:hypothetical protein
MKFCIVFQLGASLICFTLDEAVAIFKPEESNAMKAMHLSWASITFTGSFLLI